ncbi:MucR family transcriptional regulator [Oceanibaculum pacificum]|uniref:Transcriptional regulator n=1 Tax=Oceanibaculum pacificum TaxID=580166 RepID=A0A154W8M7_9PROT|nr:MucR family transcriptional regulator [Oceanibaculum pacificum]KZD09846.1 transcriptional regulator [Oceanibaculum pacificum]
MNSESAEEKKAQNDLLRMTAEVVSAYVQNNVLPSSQLSEVIGTIYNSLRQLNGQAVAQLAPEPQKPAIPVRRSVTDEYIICLEDGKKLKMLKRHLRTNYSMTPEEYRAKWGLPADYPMVAPNYAKQRSAFAKKIGLGRGSSGGRSKKG